MGASTKRKAEALELETVKIVRSLHIQPKTATQDYLINCIENSTMSVVIGPAGVGKTYITAMCAAKMFLNNEIKQIVITRPNVATGRSIGYFPGTVEEKMAPWLAPVLNTLREALGKGKFEYCIEKGQIQLQPIETIRGQSFERSFVIVDESQNLCMEEIKAITTRLGDMSKLVMMGDPHQSDLSHGADLMRFAELCVRNNIEIPVVRFGVEDIVRSDVVARLVKMFLKENI